MAVLFMDGFDTYGSTNTNTNTRQTIVQSNMLAGPYSYLGQYSSPGGSLMPDISAPDWGPARTGPYCLKGATAGTGGGTRRVLPATNTRIFASFGFALDDFNPGSELNAIFSIADINGDVIAYLKFTPTGALQIVDNGVVVATTSGPVLIARNWHFFEMDINTAGNWTVRVDDALATESPVLIGPLSGGTIAQIRLLNISGVISGASQCWMDDLLVRDTSGGINDGWLGDRRVATLFVNEDTATAGWDPSYYREISPGVGTISRILTGISAIQSPTARITTLGTTALDIGANDFTLETYVRFDQLPTTTTYATIFNRWNETSSTGRSYRLLLGGPSYNGGNLEFQTSTDGSGSTAATKISYPWTPEANQWYHVALCRSGGDLLLFVDGEQLGLPVADSDTYYASSAAAFAIGSYYPFTTILSAGTSGTQLVGLLDETRFTNGVSRYTAPFTPSFDMFPRGAVNDPDWSSVVLLLGYDAGITDESSYARALSTTDAGSFLPTDGASIGAWSTVGMTKANPDDNTFISASLTNAINILTLTTNPADADTVTVATTDGTTPAVYTFVNTLVSAYDVLIGADAEATLENLMNAINAGTGEGTTYGTGTLANNDVLATDLPVGQIMVTALLAGAAGNSLAVGSSSPGVWEDPATLYGGQDIPGPSTFKFERPPTNTTIISAVQLNVRARKTDAGSSSIRTGLVGPLGGITYGDTHALTLSGVYYPDVIETDPDTSGPLSPTTLINGGITIDRTI